jgi:4-oxalmesaconate hydratase
VLFGSETLGAVRGVDSRTGHHFDDTRRYVDAAALSDVDRVKVYTHNALRVYPRLGSLAGTGKGRVRHGTDDPAHQALA